KSGERAERDTAVEKSPAREPPVLAACGLTLDGLGNRALLSLLRSGRLQRKARISQPHDQLEHEADRAADKIVAGECCRPPAQACSTSRAIQRMATED